MQEYVHAQYRIHEYNHERMNHLLLDNHHHERSAVVIFQWQFA